MIEKCSSDASVNALRFTDSDVIAYQNYHDSTLFDVKSSYLRKSHISYTESEITVWNFSIKNYFISHMYEILDFPLCEFTEFWSAWIALAS